MLVRFLDFNINYFRKSILFFCNKKSWKRSRTREKSSSRLWCTGWTTRYHPVHHSGGELLSRVLERFQDFFDFGKNNMLFPKNIFKSKICPGIQKSYLENSTSIKNISNRKNIFVCINVTNPSTSLANPLCIHNASGWFTAGNSPWEHGCSELHDSGSNF